MHLAGFKGMVLPIVIISINYSPRPQTRREILHPVVEISRSRFALDALDFLASESWLFVAKF